MAAIGELSVKLTSDTADFSSGLDKAKQSTSSFSSLASGALMGVGMAAFNMAAGAASSFAGFASDGINMASDLNETVSKVQTVFGDNATAIQAWAASAATSMGQTSSDALAAAAGFGNLFVSMGLTKDSSADMSMNLVQLATDLGSFNNMSTDEALQKLKAGMLGSAEPMQSLGVNMNAAMVSAKALEMGLAASTAELTPAMLAQARYAIILDQTKTAQGDFAKTSDGLANQQRIADAQWKELQTTLGTAFLPVMLAVTKALNDLLTNVMPPISAFIKDSLTPAMTSISEAIGPSITATIGYFKQMYDTVGPIITQAVAWFNGLGATVKTNTDGPMSYMSKWFDDNMPRIQKIVDTVLTAIQGFWDAHGAAIMHVVENTLSVITLVFDTAFKTIMDAVTFFLQLFTGDFEGAGATLAGIVERLWSTVKTVFQTQINSIWTLVSDIDWMGLGFDIVQGIANGIGGAAQVLMSAVDRLSQSAWDSMTGWWDTGSPSQLADKELGQMIGQGFGLGIPKGLDSVMGRVNQGMTNMLDGLMTNAAPGLSVAGASAGNTTSAGITQNFYGNADPAAVGAASLSGVRSGLRAVGRG